MNSTSRRPSLIRRSVTATGIAGAIAATALLATHTAAANSATHHPGQTAKKPTVVLVHGAFADSSSWNGVIKDLRREGYPVIAPANPLRGLHEDAAYLRSVLDSIPGPVVLAGHSYGGSVLSEAADGSGNVKALVYIASFQPEAGESTSALAAKFPGGKLGEALHSVPVPLAGGGTATDLYIEQDKFRAVFAADVPSEIAELMAATQRPITSAALDDIATKTAWKTIPSWSLITTQDLAIPADSMRFMSQRANSHTTEIDASHAVTVSQPHAVSNIINKAARATTR